MSAIGTKLHAIGTKLHAIADEVNAEIDELENQLFEERQALSDAENALSELREIEPAVFSGKGGSCVGCGRSTDRHRSIFSSVELRVCPDCDAAAGQRAGEIRTAVLAAIR